MMTNNRNTYLSTRWILAGMFALCTSSSFAQSQLKTDQSKTDKMAASDFTTTLLVDQSPEQAFDAINNVRGWWSEGIEGSTDKLNGEFTYHFEDVHYCQMKITEFVPDKKVVWLVKYNYFNFTKDRSEWTGTKISFEIARKGEKTQIRFTHHGLVPAYECFNICSNAWGQYINESLLSLITTGKGQPNKFNKRVIAQ